MNPPMRIMMDARSRPRSTITLTDHEAHGRSRTHDINLRAAYVHVLADA